MLRKILALTLSFSLLFQYSGFAQTATLNLSGYLSQGSNPVVSDRFRPIHLKYFSYQPATNDYNILLDKGDFAKGLSPLALSEVEGQGTVPDEERLKATAQELMRYFLIGVTLPDDKFWVNLRPDAPEQIIDEELAQTDIGQVMLEADLKLKQDTALFTSPKTPQGKVYWEKLYQKAGELFGTENITIPTLTRPWIVPGEIIIRESAGEASGSERAQASRSASTERSRSASTERSRSASTERSRSAYIYKATLKVMLEEDYLKSSQLSALGSQQYEFNDSRLKELNQYSTQLIKELILPKLTQKVNSSKDYAKLRQVYFSLVLARWFKETYKGETRNQSTETRENSYIKLIDSKDLINLSSKQAWDKTTYFKAYQKSFKEGEYNLSEPVYTPGGQVIRRYMSGGIVVSAIVTNGFKNNNPAIGTENDKVLLNGNDQTIPNLSEATMSGSPLTREPSLFGPHPSQEGLRPLYERIAGARKHSPEAFKIKDIYPFSDQKHGRKPTEAISFGMVLEGDKNTGEIIINQNAPVMGGISAGEAEPQTHPSIKEAIDFFNKNVKPKLIGLNISQPDTITDKIIEIDEEFRNSAENKEKPRFSYIGAELSVGISMISTIALAEALTVPVEVVINYRYNEYALAHGLAKELRPMSIPVNYSVVWEGGKHGVAKYLLELVAQGVIKDISRFPKRFLDEKLIQAKDKSILLAMVPPQELQIMVFAPEWDDAREIGIKLTEIYEKLLEENGIKTKYGAESGFTTEQLRDKDGKLITLELVLDILEKAVSSLPPEEAKYVRYVCK